MAAEEEAEEAAGSCRPPSPPDGCPAPRLPRIERLRTDWARPSKARVVAARCGAMWATRAVGVAAAALFRATKCDAGGSGFGAVTTDRLCVSRRLKARSRVASRGAAVSSKGTAMPGAGAAESPAARAASVDRPGW